MLGDAKFGKAGEKVGAYVIFRQVAFVGTGYKLMALIAPRQLIVNADDFGLSVPASGKLAVKTGIQENTAALLALLENRGSAEYRDMVLANSAVALRLKSPQSSLQELVVKAAESLDSGRAKEALTRLLSF